MEGKDGGMKKESRGRVKKILYPAKQVGSRGNQLDSWYYYYTTQQLDTATQTCKETVSISYIIRKNTGATVTKSRTVWVPVGSTEVISLITA